jgi:hypothetical protein
VGQRQAGGGGLIFFAQRSPDVGATQLIFPAAGTGGRRNHHVVIRRARRASVPIGRAAAAWVHQNADWEGTMSPLKRLVAAACAAAFFAATIAPATRAEDKPLTPQQQRMKDCAAKWKDEKARTGAKGGTAYRTFMSKCLKAT